jgi:ABC-2 type transport system ATP-binding protein
MRADEATSGSVRVFGIDAARQPDTVKRLIGYMPQTAFAMRDLLVEEAVYFTARLKGLSHAGALSQRADLLRTFGLDEVRRQPISQLSGGMQRTAGFVMALLARPRCWCWTSQPTTWTRSAGGPSGRLSGAPLPRRGPPAYW